MSSTIKKYIPYIKNRIPRITITLTDSCNFNCYYCCGPNKGNYFLPIQYLKIFIHNYKIISNEPISINITGGEPTLHPDIYKIVNMFSKYSCVKEILMCSNGSAAIDLYDNLFKISDKFLLFVTYHPNNNIGKTHYINLVNNLTKYENRFEFNIFMDYETLDKFQNDIEYLIKNKIKYTYNPMFNSRKYTYKKTDNKIIKYLKEKNILRESKIIYIDNNIEIINDFEYIDRFSQKNDFINLHCERIYTAWNLERNVIFCSCFPQISGNYIFKKSFKNFINTMKTKNMVCNKHICNNGFGFYKYQR